MANPCVYCGNECHDRDLEMEHRADCASVTNLWPVLDRALRPHGIGCLRCDHTFSIGEFYTRSPYTDEEGHTHDGGFEVLCLSCAAAVVLA